MRMLYMMFRRDKGKKSEKSRLEPSRTLIVLGSGGHTAEMLRIVANLDPNKYSPRVYVCAKTDSMSVKKLLVQETGRTDYRVVLISRSREVGQSYWTSILTTLRAILESVPLVCFQRPHLVLSNGPGTCLPICIIAFLAKAILFAPTKIVFIESICRVVRLSLTGRLLYYFADSIVVQWPKLAAKQSRHTLICN